MLHTKQLLSEEKEHIFFMQLISTFLRYSVSYSRLMYTMLRMIVLIVYPYQYKNFFIAWSFKKKFFFYI